jgi:UDP-N-acetylglucosamine:LPS N-acetylglucosamine transferase
VTHFGRRPGTPAKKVLAVASSGGHWTQLVRLAPALDGHRVTWVTTNRGYKSSCPPGTFRAVRDASMWDKKGLAVMFGQIVKIVAQVRPEIVISTGAAPGFFAVRLGNMIGAKTIWVDSIANAQELSLSGRRLHGHADLYLTQWEHLARPDGPLYRGRVL